MLILINKQWVGDFNGHRLYTGLRLDYRLSLWACASHAIYLCGSWAFYDKADVLWSTCYWWCRCDVRCRLVRRKDKRVQRRRRRVQRIRVRHSARLTASQDSRTLVTTWRRSCLLRWKNTKMYVMRTQRSLIVCYRHATVGKFLPLGGQKNPPGKNSFCRQ